MADIDETVAAGLCQQLARIVGGALQLGNILGRFANDPAARAVILQLEIKDGNLDRGSRLGAAANAATATLQNNAAAERQ